MFKLENSIVKLTIENEKVNGEKEKQLDKRNKYMVTVKKENGAVKKRTETVEREKCEINPRTWKDSEWQG